MSDAALLALDRAVGDFVFTRDAEQRPLSAEGWLAGQPAARDPGAQASVSAGLPGYHAGHLIPAQFGGPGGTKNLVPMPGVVNTSYVAAVERAIGRYLTSGPVYLRVTVTYVGQGPVPARVRHELFRRTSATGISKLPGGDVITNVNARPGAPAGKMSNARDAYTGRKVPPKEFLDVNSVRGRGRSGPH